jgi:membrane protein DedA with SNARE-associated domain
MTFIEPSAAFISDLIASVGYPGLAILMAMDATVLPVPSAVVLGFAGYLSYQGKFDLVLVTIIGAMGSTVGSLLMYAMGRWGGRPFLLRFGRYIGMKEQKMRSAEIWFERYGDYAVFLAQLLPIARDLISFPAGIVKMRAVRFVLLSILGSLPFCFVLALVGYMAGPSWESAVEAVDRYDLVIVAIVMLPLLGYLIYRWNRNRTGSAIASED